VIEDANEAKVITNFSTDQTVYEAALQMGAQILLPSLVNYLPS
jgi:flagellar hook-associated protein 3 FlgL